MHINLETIIFEVSLELFFKFGFKPCLRLNGIKVFYLKLRTN